jgi:Leucine-rich repeat (LRR) protein
MKNAFSNLPKLETLQLFGNQLDNLNKNIMLDVPKNINIANIDIS